MLSGLIGNNLATNSAQCSRIPKFFTSQLR